MLKGPQVGPAGLVYEPKGPPVLEMKLERQVRFFTKKKNFNGSFCKFKGEKIK